MDSSVFRDDSTKLSLIRQMLTQANELIGDVDGHLKDHGERLARVSEELDDGQRLELERLKQALIEKEDELRSVRGERLKFADDLQEALSKLAAAERSIAELKTKREASESSLESRCRNLEDELRKVVEQNRAYERRLSRVTSQAESLLRAREGLLDLVRTSDVRVELPPPSPADVPRDQPLIKGASS